MLGEFKKVNERFDAVDLRIDHLTNAMDAFAKQSETDTQEMLALGNKVDRESIPSLRLFLRFTIYMK